MYESVFLLLLLVFSKVTMLNDHTTINFGKFSPPQIEITYTLTVTPHFPS